MRKTKATRLHTSKRRDPRQCEGKTKYPSERKAKTGVRLLRERGEDVHPYPCDLCGRWHVGHGP